MPPVARRDKKSIMLWKIISLTLLASCLIAMTTVHIYQFVILKRLNHELTLVEREAGAFDALMQKIEILKQQEIELINQKNSIEQAKKQMSSFVTRLTSLIESARSNIEIHTMSLYPTKLELHVSSRQPEQLKRFFTHLSQLESLKDVSLASVRTDGEHTTAVIHAVPVN